VGSDDDQRAAGGSARAISGAVAVCEGVEDDARREVRDRQARRALPRRVLAISDFSPLTPRGLDHQIENLARSEDGERHAAALLQPLDSGPTPSTYGLNAYVRFARVSGRS
jgi:hypothetical protein